MCRRNMGGIGAAASGMLVLPGGDAVTPLAATVVGMHAGSAIVDLGPAPKDVTDVAREFTCLTPDRFEFGGWGDVTCDVRDVGTRSAQTSGTMALAPGEHSVTITTTPAARWEMTAWNVKKTTTDWAVNAHGQSCGVQNANGAPDLIAVEATNGNAGYVLRTELEEKDGTTAAESYRSPQDALAWQDARRGKTFHVPVYEPDGTIVIGDFVIG